MIPRTNKILRRNEGNIEGNEKIEFRTGGRKHDSKNKRDFEKKRRKYQRE